MILIVIAGHLDNPVIAVDALSIWYASGFIFDTIIYVVWIESICKLVAA